MICRKFIKVTPAKYLGVAQKSSWVTFRYKACTFNLQNNKVKTADNIVLKKLILVILEKYNLKYFEIKEKYVSTEDN